MFSMQDLHSGEFYSPAFIFSTQDLQSEELQAIIVRGGSSFYCLILAFSDADGMAGTVEG